MTRSIDLSVEVPGTPEEVWDAIATGPGITSWFVPAAVAVEEGTVTCDFGPYGKDVTQISVWEPPRRFVAGTGDFACEWLVEARDRGTCVVRLVNSGFSEDAEFDEQYHSTLHGWTVFLENLRLHRTHFAGRQAEPATVIAATAGPADAAWKALCEDLGLGADLATGDRFEAVGGPRSLTGVVERRIEEPTVLGYIARFGGDLEGTGYVAVEGAGDEVGVRVFLYLYGEDGPTAAGAWREWGVNRPAHRRPADTPA
jgi:uncharacterized protein YndB with AHSA1/START domain